MLVFVASERREFVGLLRHATQVKQLDWPLEFARAGELRGKPVVLVANGPGPKLAGEAAEAAKKRERVDALLSIGYCGALDPSLKLYDIVVSGSLQLLTRGRGQTAKEGTLLSLDRVITTAAEKAELRKTGADAVEMESAGVAAKAREWNVPFLAVKIVTDESNESLTLDFNRFRGVDGRFRRAAIVRAALARPSTLIPALLQLNNRAKSAAQALGDFIADAQL